MDTTKYDFLKTLHPDRFFLMAGPCVIEDETSPLFTAETLKNICQKLNIPFVFKGSYRKANRSRLDSFTGIGDEKGRGLVLNHARAGHEEETVGA